MRPPDLLAFAGRALIGHRLRSALTVATLQDMGFEAAHLKDGFAGWVEKGGQLIDLDTLLFTGLLYQLSCQGCALLGGNHPAHHITTKDVDDGIQREMRPFGRTAQLGNVPTPHLARSGGNMLLWTTSNGRF